jgi:hypothetical protein
MGRRIALGQPLPRRPRLRDVVRLLSKAVEDVDWRVTPRNVPGVTTPCWIWQGGCDDRGYGFIKVDGHKRWAHRVSYEGIKGPLAAGMDADHLCFNHACINPDHLKEEPRKVNERRRPPAVLIIRPRKRKRKRELVKVGAGDDVAPF